MKLLHVDSSIQGDASASRALSAAVVAQLLATDPSLEITYRDLAAAPLPHVDLEGLATATATPMLREFLDADIVVIGAPMYNFSISSQLKAWIDHIVVAGQTFRYGPEGAVGLAGGKHVIVAHSRGGIYSQGPAAEAEHAERYLRAILSFIGISDPEFIVAEGLALGLEQREAAMAAALAKAAKVEPASLITV
ncbi:FMN-dependent NADH-azoreductase [Pedomonas mirosovicensis]|uniref:FMN-dependent NADH-azoreductase n=1 Tax=Pedomonas mirosovicensis TaxID=2908641 RepID=UPI0021695E81|nr:NAD(P)H-dependent oxidoreductase [Pedomonas mirosovicensis]MCH8686384.1 NAD(P)H-dependent oxidoreductase [Pedomonas mirosovicensis]